MSKANYYIPKVGEIVRMGSKKGGYGKVMSVYVENGVFCTADLVDENGAYRWTWGRPLFKTKLSKEKRQELERLCVKRRPELIPRVVVHMPMRKNSMLQNFLGGGPARGMAIANIKRACLYHNQGYEIVDMQTHENVSRTTAWIEKLDNKEPIPRQPHEHHELVKHWFWGYSLHEGGRAIKQLPQL